MRTVLIQDCPCPITGTDEQIQILLKVHDLGDMSIHLDSSINLEDASFILDSSVSDVFLSGEFLFSFGESDTGYEIFYEDKNAEVSIEEMKAFPNFISLVVCDDCNGSGFVEVGDCKVGSASICCGGCTKFIPCKCEQVVYH